MHERHSAQDRGPPSRGTDVIFCQTHTIVAPGQPDTVLCKSPILHDDHRRINPHKFDIGHVRRRPERGGTASKNQNHKQHALYDHGIHAWGESLSKYWNEGCRTPNEVRRPSLNHHYSAAIAPLVHHQITHYIRCAFPILGHRRLSGTTSGLGPTRPSARSGLP